MAILLENEVAQNPVDQFKVWFNQVMTSSIQEPTAVTLATCTKDAVPTARVVLLKDYDEQGMVFFTNYESRKGHELMNNPKATLLFYWQLFGRQIRIEGIVERIDAATSDEYFASRPKGSRIGAIASTQSRPISKAELDKNVADLSQKYVDTDIVPRPNNWGGFRLIPHYFEFWQGQENRLHDRIVYEKVQKNDWKIYRIAP